MEEEKSIVGSLRRKLTFCVVCSNHYVYVYCERWLDCGCGKDITVLWSVFFPYPSHTMYHALWRLMNHIWIIKWMIFHSHLPFSSLLFSSWIYQFSIVFVYCHNFCHNCWYYNIILYAYLRFQPFIAFLVYCIAFVSSILCALLLFVLHIWHGARAPLFNLHNDRFESSSCLPRAHIAQ